MTALPSPAATTDATPPAAPGTDRRRRYALLAVTTASGSALVGLWRHSPVTIAFVVIATASCAALAVQERRSPMLALRPVVVAIAIMFAAAVAAPPRTSNDLWSYTIYGRMVSVYGASPYQKLPVDFRTDPFYKYVSPIWHHRGSVYGPVFVGYAAAGTWLVGNSVILDRLFFQLSAAVVAAFVLWLVWRRTKSLPALIWLGMSPLLAPVIVNGGHNDIAIGLAILAAAYFARRQLGWLAGIVIGLAAMVKLTALLAVVGVVLWAWRQRARRVAVTTVVGTAGTLLVGYLPFAGGASHVLAGSDKTLTPASPYNWLGAALIGHDAGRDVPHPLAPNTTLHVIFYVSLVGLAVLSLTVGWFAARARRPGPAIGATVASYTVGAEYSYPWYAGWAMPVLTEHAPSPLAWVVWVQASVMLAALKLPIHPHTGVLETILRGTITYVTPPVLLVAFIVAGTKYALRPRDLEPA